MHSGQEMKKVPLTEKEAVVRKHHLLVNNHYTVSYNVLLKLLPFNPESPSTSSFIGRVEVKFNYNNTNSTADSLFLDFFNTITSLTINGKNSSATVKDMKISLDPTRLLHNQMNTVVILFTSRYTNNGSGLHAYTDPQDKKSYLYSHFEPFDCHQVFPCFDQPDIKATLKLVVLAPSNWEVFANEHEDFSKTLNKNSINDIDVISVLSCLEEREENFLFDDNQLEKGEYRLHSFRRTPRISPYLYALCAGEYYIYANPFEFRIPMRLMMRHSLKNLGEFKEMFRVTMAGMNYYEKFFGVEFPFSKYDQIFTPEYNMGAMENVGLVTFNEAYCWRSKPTQRQRTGFAITNLHELAHMWFGNLVTMTWWNDLWLNESFATFISHLCLDDAPELKDYKTSWLIFNSMKGGAYREDQLSTTHPVMSEVKNTDIAETHFDSIVYIKGSSLLKQIFYFIGKENFRKGLVEYFKTFKWDNTVFSEFINKMVEVLPESKSNLSNLCENWLQKAGLNELHANWEHSNGKVTKFVVEQNPCLDTFPNRQTHVLDIQSIYSDGHAENFVNVTINPEAQTDLASLFVGKNAPSAVILNYNDWAYLKWNADKTTLAYFQDKLHTITDTLTRQMIYRSLFDLVRDARMSSLQYLDIVKKNIVFETDPDILTTTLSMVSGVISFYIPLKHHQEYIKKMHELVSHLISKETFDDDTIKVFLRHLISFSCSEEHRNTYVNWLRNGAYVVNPTGSKVSIKSSLITQQIRFTLVKLIHHSKVISNEEKAILLEKEVENDKNSEQSALARYACYAARPEPEIKKELWEKYTLEPTKESLKKMEESMSYFVCLEHVDDISNYLKERFFEDVFKIIGKVDRFYIDSFFDNLSPSYFVDEEMIAKLEKLLEKSTDDMMKKKVMTLIDDMKRRYKAHKLCSC